MEKEPSEILVYLDHNILDSLVKGDCFNVKALLEKNECVVVFSNENIKEIEKSKGYEQKFLEVLKDLKARHLTPMRLSKNTFYRISFLGKTSFSF